MPAGKLEPCPNPWCFSISAPVPIGLRNSRGNPSGWRVACACGVQTFRAETKQQAVVAWNTRTASYAGRKALEAGRG